MKRYFHYQDEGGIRQNDAVPYPTHGDISADEAECAKLFKRGLVAVAVLGVIAVSLAVAMTAK